MYLKDENYLTDMWPICRAVMDRSFSYVKSADGLLENSGCADQTYDSWVMHGPSAYCCSLWVAALKTMVEMSLIMGDKNEEMKFKDTLIKAQKALYDKLWNGTLSHFLGYIHTTQFSISLAAIQQQGCHCCSFFSKNVH